MRRARPAAGRFARPILVLALAATTPNATSASAPQNAWEDEKHPLVGPRTAAEPIPASGIYRFPTAAIREADLDDRGGERVVRLRLGGSAGEPVALDLRCGERGEEVLRTIRALEEAQTNLVVHVRLDAGGDPPRSARLEPAHVSDLLDVYHCRRPYGFSEERLFEVAEWEGRLYARDASLVSLLLRTFWCDRGLYMCRILGAHYEAPFFRDRFIRFGAIVSQPDSEDGQYLRAVRDLYRIGRGATTAHGPEGGPEIRYYRAQRLIGSHRTYISKAEADVAAGWGVRISYAEAQARYTLWKGTAARPYSTAQRDFDLYVGYFIANGVIDRYLERLARSPMPEEQREDVRRTVAGVQARARESDEWRRTLEVLAGGEPPAPRDEAGSAGVVRWLAAATTTLLAATLAGRFLRRRRSKAGKHSKSAE